MPIKQYIFGYGSLVNAEDVAHTIGRVPKLIYPVRLDGWIRDWSVVIDNTVAGRRCVRLPDGRLAPCHIVVLNVRRPGAGEGPTNPNGILFEVTADDLRKLDRRETHYKRVDVTKNVVNKPTGIIYTYSGHDRFLIARNKTRMVIPGTYHELVERSFSALGRDMYNDYLISTASSSIRIHVA